MNENCIAFQAQEWCIPSPLDAWDRIPFSKPNTEIWRSNSRDVNLSLLESFVRDIEQPLRARFHKEADRWANETLHLSSPTKMMLHPSYQAILGLANENKWETIRLMLEDLRKNRRPWFWALSYLTQENPIQTKDAGKMDKMIKAWISWGTQRGFL